MIAKIPKKRKDGKSSFRELVEYIVGKEKKEREQTGVIERAVYHKTRNMGFAKEDVYLAVDEMEGLGAQNIRCKDPVFHFILSYRPHEIPTHAQVDEAVDISLKELGLEKCKSVYGLQNDTGIHHIHVCVCRIDPETEKAISPAGGWSEKALLKASRKIEISQGWEILRTDPFWDVTGDGRIVEKGKSRPDKPKLDSNAKDFEIHMGEKSAQTLAIELASPIINAARSWQELHEKLSEIGMRFERKGSGAIIAVGDEFVKASNAGRDCSLAKLEKRLGEFCDRDKSNAADGLTVPRPPEPTAQVESSQRTVSAWKRYLLYKEGYSGLKKSRNSLFADQREQRAILKEQHKRERDKLYTTSWKGRGKELNLERRLLAAQQLRDKQKILREQEAGRENLPTVPKFLSYRKWIREEQPELVSILRNWNKGESLSELKGVAIMRSLNAEIVNEPVKKLIQFDQFEWQKDKNNIIYYRRYNEKSPSFIHKDKEIEVMKSDESSILASMQLAQQMWGGVKISDASKDFCDTCLKLAAEHGIKIQLPKEYLVEKAKEDAPPTPISMPTSATPAPVSVPIPMPTSVLPTPIPTTPVPSETPTLPPSEPTATQIPTAEPVVVDVFLEAENIAASIVPRQNLKRAWYATPYKGVVVGNEHEIILLQTRKDEIVLVPADTLAKIPKIGEKIEIKRAKDSSSLRDVSFLDRDRGR